MLKKMLRQEVLETLKRQDLNLKRTLDLALIHRLLSHPAYRSARTVATYLAMPFEVDTTVFIQEALKDGKRLVVPKVIGPGEMIFVVYDKQELTLSDFGVLEPTSSLEVAPSEIDMIHVPGVVFNSQGYRIGFGGGFYDRYLERFTGTTLSTVYPIQCRDFEPEAHDLPVREVIRYEIDS